MFRACTCCEIRPQLRNLNGIKSSTSTILACYPFALPHKMERWQNCVAVVTGASSGIGEVVVRQLLEANVIVVGLARRKQRMEQNKASYTLEQQKRFHAVQCDISSLESVNAAFDWIIEELGAVDILVNNAGIFKIGQLSSMEIGDLERILQTNVMGAVYCTQRAFKSMRERNFDGHIITVNSDLGHSIPAPAVGAPFANIYPPSKYALRAMAEMLRLEFKGLQTKIKITNVSPSKTDTEILDDAWKTDGIILQPEDVAHCILFAISTPKHVQIHEIQVNPI